jgi:hypothetical protein
MLDNVRSLTAKPEEEKSKRRLMPSYPIHLIGAIVVWALILVSPTLGPLTVGFLPDRISNPYYEMHQGIWRPFLNTLGYSFYGSTIRCTAANPDETLIALICLVFGIGIGTVGALFQAAAIKRRLGSVRPGTILQLSVLWGIILGSLSAGATIIQRIDSDGGCSSGSGGGVITPVLSIIFTPIFLFSGLLYLFPIPGGFFLVLLAAAVITHRYWKLETKGFDEQGNRLFNLGPWRIGTFSVLIAFLFPFPGIPILLGVILFRYWREQRSTL